MKMNQTPHWIRHSHFFGSDEYECSRCGKVFTQKGKVCPNCGVTLRSEKDDLGWIDELEELDMILDDE